MTFAEFQKKKKEGSLINRNTQSQSSSNTKMTFDEFKAKKQDGTLISPKSTAVWTESTAPNILEKQNINTTVKPVNISDFVNNINATANQQQAKKYFVDLPYNTNKQSSKDIIYKGDVTATEGIGTTIGKIAATPVAGLAQLGTGAAQGLESAMDFGTSIGVSAYNALERRRIKSLEQGIEKYKAEGNSEMVKKLEEEKNKTEVAIDLADKRAEAFISKPWVQDYVGNSVDKFTDQYSYLPTKVGEVTKTVGNMLPAIANAGSIAKSLPQAVTKLGQAGTKIATMLPFMAQAAGSSTEQALNEGANLADATKYGLASGAVEGAIESISGGIGGSVGGKIATSGLGKEVVERIAKNSLGKYALKLADAGIDVFGEGFEEVLSTAINPRIQRMTYDERAELATSEELMQSFIDGALASLLLKGGQAGLSRFTTQNNVAVQENGAQNQAQMQNIEQSNVKVPTQVERAQKTNLGQSVNNVDSNDDLKYNISRGDKNGELQFGRVLGANNQSSGIYKENKSEQASKYTRAEYEQFENYITPIAEERITETERELINKYKTKYKKDVVLFDGNQNSGFGGGASLTDKNRIYIDINEANEFGYNMIASHEVMESDILHNKELKTDIIDNIAQAIINDPNFEQQKIEFWKGQEGDIPSDYLIAKDIICDRFAELDNNEGLSYKNVLSQETNMNLDFGINNFRNMIKGNQADTQSAFSMPENYISPVSDIQGATEFVNKATIKDIETLQKMVEEAEKNPNRIDLQFFAEEAKKKIEYLTKSQRYQKNKVDTLINKLQKMYGLDKAQVKKSIDEYIEAYNSDGDVLEARDTLLKELSPNGILGEFASIEISNDIDNLNRELDTVKRYETDKAKNEEKRDQNKNYYKVNKETIAKLYQLKKEYQENADKAMKKILLTKGDSVQLDRLLKDEISFSELPKSANVEQIRKAYDVRKPLADVNKEIQNYNKAVKQQRNDKMRELTKNSAQWKDKKIGLAYARETQERNIADIAPAEDAKRINKEIFAPIHHNEAEATRYKNEMRNKIKELNIDIKPKYEVTYADSEGGKTETVSESGLVQLYGEGKINDETLSRLGVYSEKIKKAVATFREIYNDLYNKTNDALVQNGYAPVEFRKDYFPHFEETKPDTIIGKALNKLGFKMDTKELPTDIAGLTHTFRPGKKWVSNFLQRTTDVATYDAVKGFDSYLDSVADVIYHTDDIQNLRAYENALRYQHSDPVIKEQIDEIVNMDIANEMKQSMIDQLYANAENSLAHYVTDLRAYTDNLAGKKSLEDRTMEHNLGRGIYNITKNVQNRVSANMVGANISSALTNFIPLTQAMAVIDGKNLIQATYDTLKNSIKSDGFAEQSDFLTNRRGSDKLYKTVTDKLAGATNLMSLLDNFTSEVINRGRYYQNVANGMSETDARAEADQMSGNIMADRSKGSMPTVFNQSSPVTKLLTAFQLEVNNQYSYLFKDIPKEYKDKAIGSLVWAFAKMFIGAWLYNELYEEITGRRAALDPINIVAETVGDVAEGKKASEVVSGLATEVVEDIPFVGGLIGGGRLPISNALPDAGETVKAGISLFEEGDKKKAWQTLASELSKPVFYILPPFGGGQLKKSAEGISTFMKGGNYGVNSKGEETLKYPVEQTPGNFVKSALFGKWSTKGAVDYVDNGFKALSANQTEGYEKAKKAGISDKYFYDAYNAQKKVEGLGDLTSLVKKNEIDKVTKGLSAEKRKILYETFNVSKSEWGNSKIVYPYEIKAQKEKIAREKLKTKKK